jgi:hypothetical protein
VADELHDPATPDTTPLRADGVTVWMHVEAISDEMANGRETAAYVLGFWRRHVRDVPPEYDTPVKLCARVRRAYLGAVLSALVAAGANASVYRDDPTQDAIEVEFSTV